MNIDSFGDNEIKKYTADWIFFLISQGLCSHVTQADIIPGYRTDHSVIIFSLTLKSNPRGPGFWKLNTSLFD